jgi:hypothetical protein
MNALDTLRYEQVEKEWFRLLPGRVGHSVALDMAIKAIVTACAFGRGRPGVTLGHCYRALAPALDAVQASIKESNGEPNDDILATTALLAPVDGAISQNGISRRTHVEGLAAILAARTVAYPVTQLGMEIFDFHACESATMACVKGTPSPFECINPAYFAAENISRDHRDRSRLKAIGLELFVRIPRLVMLVRSLRDRSYLQARMLEGALSLSKSLDGLQDNEAEMRLLSETAIYAQDGWNGVAPDGHGPKFAAVKDFEALMTYWLNRLVLLRLTWRIRKETMSGVVNSESPTFDGASPQLTQSPSITGMLRIVEKIVMCSGYARTLPLRRHVQLFAHAILAVWGVELDVPKDLWHECAGENTLPSSDSLLQVFNIMLPSNPEFTAEDLDAAAEIYVGGRPGGRVAELYAMELAH